MPRLNWNEVPDTQVVPNGTYVIELTSIDSSGTTKDGYEMWDLAYAILEPKEFKGRFIYENLPFSPKAMWKVRKVCHGLGLKTEGEVDLTPSALKGRCARVEVYIEDSDPRFPRKNKIKEYEPLDCGVGKRLEDIANSPGSALAKAADAEDPPF